MIEDLGILSLASTTVVLGALNNISSKIRSITLGPFNYFVSFLNASVYLVMYSLILLYRYKTGAVTKREVRFFWKYKPSTNPELESLLEGSSSPRPVPHRMCIPTPLILATIAGCMDASGNILGFIAQEHLPQVVYQLFLQDLLIFSVVISIILLAKRYNWLHYTSICIVVSAGIFSLIPKMDPNETSNTSFKYCMVAAVSTLPTAISYVLKEKIFEEYRILYPTKKTLDLFAVTTHIALVQVIVVPLLSPISLVLGETKNQSMRVYIEDGLHCLASKPPPLGRYDLPTEHCAQSLLSYLVYAVFNIGFNVALLAMTKMASSVHAWIVVRLILPVTLLMLAVPVWPLLESKDIGISVYIVIGTVMALVGAFTFRYATVHSERFSKFSKDELARDVASNNQTKRTTVSDNIQQL